MKHNGFVWAISSGGCHGGHIRGTLEQQPANKASYVALYRNKEQEEEEYHREK